MIDFHSHILPRMDDGSKDLDESLALLHMLAEQRISTVVATSHFYADHESVDHFLDRRERAYESLETVWKDGLPRVIRGAEVRFYSGVSQMQDLPKLCAGNSRLLLLEMPAQRWTDYVVKELCELAGRGDLTVVLAHMERYMGLQSADTLKHLYDHDISIQCNANFFLQFSTKRKALSMLKNGRIRFIGSDCHNLTTRPPRIGQAYDLIEKKVGGAFLEAFHDYGRASLGLPHYT